MGSIVNVSLPPELESFVAEQVRSGAYRDADHVVSEALAYFKAAREEYDARLAALRREIQRGIDSIERGDVFDGRETFARILAELAETETETEREARLADLRAALKIGADQLARGEGIPASVVFDRVRARLAERRAP